MAHGFVVFRALSLVQAVIGVSMRSLTTSHRPHWTFACLGVVAVESVVIGVWLCRKGSVLVDRRPLALDIAVAVAALEAVSSHTLAAERMSAWGMGVHQVSLCTAILMGLVIRTFVAAVLSAGGLAVFFFVVTTWDVWGQWTRLAASGTDAATYLGFVCMAWVFARFTRGLADRADDARRRVAELERQRARAAVHDLLPYLRPELFTHADEPTRALRVQQARVKYRQMRAFVDGAEPAERVDTSLRTVLDLHPTLNIRARFELSGRTRLSPQVQERLLHAVDTALANVEQNAPKATVVVRAAPGRQTLTVAVHDDGPGFDPDDSTPGYGIGAILGRHLTEVGGRANVDSVPGRGTDVTIVVPLRAPQGAVEDAAG